MHLPSTRPGLLRAGLLLSGLLFLPLHARAGILPIEGSAWLKEQTNTKQLRDTFKALEEGRETPNKDNEKVIDLMAMWFTHRATWPDYQNEPGGMDRLFGEFHRELDGLQRFKGLNTRFREAFAHQLVAHLKEVLQDDLPIARINGARMLADMAELAPQESADALCEVVQDSQQLDAVKLYALRGLKGLFVAHDPPKAPAFKDKAREANCAAALLGFVGRKVPNATVLPEDEQEALKLVRREAVRSLSQLHYPSLKVDGKRLPVAGGLLQVLTGAGLELPPRLDEQVEAVVGLCNTRPSLDPDYQPDFAAQRIGRFFVEFTARYLRRADNIRDRSEPWRVHAARMVDALPALRQDLKENPQALAYVNNVITQGTRVLKAIESNQIPQGVQELDVWIRDTPIPSMSLYKGEPPAAPGGAAAAPTAGTTPPKP